MVPEHQAETKEEEKHCRCTRGRSSLVITNYSFNYDSDTFSFCCQSLQGNCSGSKSTEGAWPGLQKSHELRLHSEPDALPEPSPLHAEVPGINCFPRP